MKIPNKLKVGGRDYEVIYPHHFDSTSDVQIGYHDPFLQKIKLADVYASGEKFHPQTLLHTLLHEILHSIDHVYCNSRILGTKDGEEIIDQLAEGLLQVIRDNNLDFRK